MTRPVVVLGAAGHTGRRVARALARRGVPVVLAGRRPAPLDALASSLEGPVRCVNVDVDRDALAPVWGGAGAVVGTVGPFLRHGVRPVAAAVAAGVPWVDTTAEQAFVRRVQDDLDVAATRSGVPVLPGHGADWAFSVLAAAVLAARVGPPTGIEAWHDLGAFRPSPGTVRSMIGMLGAPLLTLDRGVLRPVGRVAARRVALPGGERWGVPFPGGDAVLLGRDLRTLRRMTSGLLLTRHEAVGLGWATTAFGAVGPSLPARVFERIADRVAQAVPADTARAPWALHVRAVGPGGAAWCEIRGRDTYDDTGEVVAALAARLARGEAPRGGVRAAGSVLDAEAVLDDLGDTGLTWRVSPA